ncbi:YceI family protein [Brevundimonas sp. M20]|uniref:YceI family protein n=1 Tax=Brevundimonas sp. M20 TaxID=2591463 RepID=UPI0011467F4C|nr:YceI family protein [Brevundimonas sp. M20]QDH74261.1 YceI family protein [Brevundimonas sp. M20]
MRPFLRYAAVGVASIALLTGGAVVAQTVLTKVPSEVTAGAYKLDSSHGNITWSVDHMGFSTYTGQFVNVQAELSLNTSNPSASTLTATIPLKDVLTGSEGLNNHLQTADFFDTANHPTATFVSRSVTVDADDPNEATVVGDLTLRGVTKPVTIEVEFNQAGPSMGNTYKAGFDGEATIKRSDFGITYGIPMGLGDEVKLHLEGEFILQQ